MLHGAGRDEDIDPGQEGGDRPLSQQLHLHIYQEVFGLADLSLQVDGAREAVQLPGAKVALLVALDDADDDVVAGVSGGRSDSEDLGGGDDVGLEAELVVRDADRGLLTVQGAAGAAGPLAAAGDEWRERRGRERRREGAVSRVVFGGSVKTDMFRYLPPVARVVNLATDICFQCLWAGPQSRGSTPTDHHRIPDLNQNPP